MGFGTKTRALNFDFPKLPKKQYLDADKASFGKGGADEIHQTNLENGFIPREQSIEGSDYIPADHSKKGSLRQEKKRTEARDIFNNPDLSESEKREGLLKMIDQEQAHKDQFKVTKNNRKHVRDL